MKKELAALLLLAAIVIVSVRNTRHLFRLLDELERRTESVDTAAAEERWTDAAATVDTLFQTWENAKPYSQVFLRYADTEAVTDAFCVLRGAVLSKDADACRSAVFTVRTRLRSIREAERPAFGSIF